MPSIWAEWFFVLLLCSTRVREVNIDLIPSFVFLLFFFLLYGGFAAHQMWTWLYIHCNLDDKWWYFVAIVQRSAQFSPRWFMPRPEMFRDKRHSAMHWMLKNNHDKTMHHVHITVANAISLNNSIGGGFCFVIFCNFHFDKCGFLVIWMRTWTKVENGMKKMKHKYGMIRTCVSLCNVCSWLVCWIFFLAARFRLVLFVCVFFVIFSTMVVVLCTHSLHPLSPSARLLHSFKQMLWNVCFAYLVRLNFKRGAFHGFTT